MADLYSSLNNRTELQAGSPLDGWVWTQQQFSLFKVQTNQTIDTQTKANNFGYSVMEALQPVWACFPSKLIGYGWVLLEGGQSAASVKAILEDKAYVATSGDSTFTVTAATGCWNDGDDLVWDETLYYKKYDATYSYFDINSQFHDDIGILEINTLLANDAVFDYRTDPSIKEWSQLIATGQNWQSNNWRDGTGRETNFPYDLPLTNSNIALVGIHHDGSIDQDVIKDTANAYYDINGVFERLIAAAQPLGYAFEYEDESDVGTSENLAMFVDLSRFDPLHFRQEVNNSADSNADLYMYCTSLDFVWSGGTDTD